MSNALSGGIAATFRLSALVLTVLTCATPPVIANGSQISDLADQKSRQYRHAQAQEVCSGVLPSGKIVYFSCDKQPARACSGVTREGEIIYFECEDVQNSRKAN
jgi:hypothetical protein